MARRNQPSRRVLETRAPRKGTVIVAAILYVTGIFGYLGWLTIIGRELAVGFLAAAGGLLLAGALLRDL